MRSMSALLGVLISLPAVAAAAPQGGPSAADMQKFLAASMAKVVTQVHYVDAAGRTNYVTGKYTGEVKTVKGGLRKTKETLEALPERAIDKQLGPLRATALDAIDAYGRPNLCATRITRVEAPDYNETRSDTADDSRAFSFTFKYTNEAFTYEPLTKFMSPAEVIDWSDVKVTRNAEGSVTVTSKGRTYSRIYLTYVAGSQDVADGIEYAMKFLALSCGTGAGLGL